MSKRQSAADTKASEHAALEADLGRLNQVAPGLGDRAVAYVKDGTPTSVLLEIKATGDKAREKLEATKKSLRVNTLIEASAWEPVAAHRFGEVFLAADSTRRTHLTYNQANNSRVPGWLFALGRVFHDHVGHDKIKDFLSPERWAEIVSAAGEPQETLLHYLYGPDDWWRAVRQHLTSRADYFLANAELIIRTLPDLHVDGRTSLIENIARLKLGDAFFDMVFAAAIGSSKTVRQMACPILMEVSAGRILSKAKETLASSRSSSDRRETVELLAMLIGAPARDLLTAHLETEKSKPVTDAIMAALARIDNAPTVAESDGSGGMLAIDGTLIEIPPVPPLLEDTPLPAEALEPIAALIAPYNAAVEKANEATKAHHEAAGWKWKPSLRDKLTNPNAIPLFLEFLNGAKSKELTGNANAVMTMIDHWGLAQAPFTKQPFEDLFSRPDFTLWHQLRLISCNEWHTLLNRLAFYNSGLELGSLLSKLRQGLDFRVPIQILAKTGISADHVAHRVLRSTYETYYLDLDIPSLHLYFLEHIELIEEALGQRPKSGEAHLDEHSALQLLAWLPKIPARLLHPLLNVALGGSKMARVKARALLASAGGIDNAIIARLTDAKKDIRASTAGWIAARGMKAGIPALKAALKKEKAEEARAAFLTALAKLGEDISEHFSEKALKAEADKGLAKPVAKSLEWFPFTAVPRLRWKNGKAVDPVIVKWWIVLGDKLKDPAGNALFDIYLEHLKPEDAEVFGLFLLQAFIERDTTNCTEEVALETAKVSAERQQQGWQQWHQRNPDTANQYPFNYEKVFAQAKAEKLREPIFSCSENKGFLGLTMRAPGPSAGALVRRYLKDFGNKVNQSKALLIALAKNPSPAAIQVVLAVANRHKQKTVQALAKELIDSIADARGWTADELADRTIPDAGFDETGEMELDCGPERMFRAVYRGDGKIDLLNPDGKVVKALPNPRVDTDKEAVAASKKALTGARKEVKQVETMQSQRLYEAMCVGRSWEPETWASCLQRHAIAGRLCQRLIWLGLDADGGAVASFRPLEDGSLTSNTDDAVDLSGVAAIKLAHQALLPEADSEAWAAHLNDYEVAPLFRQFGGTILTADGDLKNATQIADRKGWMIDSFKLQSAVSKLGYERGEIWDGGGFTEYVKRFDGLGLRAAIEFSGSYVGANDSFPCALIGLSFQPIPGQRYRTTKPLLLGEVPPVLLSEAWGDFHTIAAAGTGFDKDWEKKGMY